MVPFVITLSLLYPLLCPATTTVLVVCHYLFIPVVLFLLQLQTIKAIVDSHSFKSPKSDEPRRVQVLDLYCLTRFESKSSSKGIVY